MNGSPMRLRYGTDQQPVNPVTALSSGARPGDARSRSQTTATAATGKLSASTPSCTNSRWSNGPSGRGMTTRQASWFRRRSVTAPAKLSRRARTERALILHRLASEFGNVSLLDRIHVRVHSEEGWTAPGLMARLRGEFVPDTATDASCDNLIHEFFARSAIVRVESIAGGRCAFGT